MHDAIIIGAGPAGMAAAIYFARQKLDFIIISKNIGGQTAWSAEVGNYLGFHLISGADLAKKFKEHTESYGVKIQSEEEVKEVKENNGNFTVISDKCEYQAKTVLVATGEKHRKLNIPGEDEFYGKGVTYCAICDAPLFSDKDIAVIGGSNSAMEAALFAAKYSKKAYIITINPGLEGDSVLIDRINGEDRIEVITSAKTTEIAGNKLVNRLKYEKKGEVKELEIKGVFIEIGLIPVSDFIGIVKKNKWGEIEVDKNNATDIEGIWAAGDVTDITTKQIAVAVGEGSKASIRMIKYIEKSK